MSKNTGTIENLAKTEMTTWEGWAIYHWDMCHCVALFNEKPSRNEWDKPNRTWNFDKAIEHISVDFLEACGVKWPYDGTRDFYYKGNLNSEHPPIKIKLILPKPLLEQLGLI